MIDPRGIPHIVQKKANDLGYSIYLSHRKGKRFYIIYKGNQIHFGAKNSMTFIDHHDQTKRKAWRARHSKIFLQSKGDNKPAYKNKKSPLYWAWHLLW